MAKDKLTDYSATNASNTDVGGVNTDEGMLPSAVNNAIREVMTHLKNFASGTDGIDVLSLADDTATNAMKIQAPSSVTTTTTLTLPDGDGTSGQTLTTNGTGTLSWSTISGGIADVVDDTTPQLGGTLDASGYSISQIGTMQMINTSGSYVTGSDGVNIFPYSDGNVYVDNYDGGFLFRGAGYANLMTVSSAGAFTATTITGYQPLAYSIGAYVQGWLNNTTTNPGGTASGSSVYWSNASASYLVGAIGVGTWRVHGAVLSGTASGEVSVWQRIA